MKKMSQEELDALVEKMGSVAGDAPAMFLIIAMSVGPEKDWTYATYGNGSDQTAYDLADMTARAFRKELDN